MKISTDSPFTSLMRAIGRFFGLDILLIISILIKPNLLFPWLILNIQSYFERSDELIYYIPYFGLFVLFICTATLRNNYLKKEGLVFPSKPNPRMISGNVLVIATVAAIALKRHMAQTIDYVSLYERATVALDILFVWVVANFVMQIVLNCFNVSFKSKEY